MCIYNRNVKSTLTFYENGSSSVFSEPREQTTQDIFANFYFFILYRTTLLFGVFRTISLHEICNLNCKLYFVFEYQTKERRTNEKKSNAKKPNQRKNSSFWLYGKNVSNKQKNSAQQIYIIQLNSTHITVCYRRQMYQICFKKRTNKFHFPSIVYLTLGI